MAFPDDPERGIPSRKGLGKKKVIAVGASASIVIPLRLQVTAENLTQIADLRAAIERHLLREYGRASSNRIITEGKHHCKIHSVSIDDTEDLPS